MPTIDLSIPEERRKAVEQGYIWSAPRAAIVKALEEVAAGTIPPPAFIPQEYAALAEELGVSPASTGGFAKGSGPA